MKRIKFVFATFLAGLMPAVVLGNSGGADPGHTGGPGDAAEGCARASCHVGTGNPTRGSGVEITFPSGMTYTPGAAQRWTIRVTGLEARGYGFQVSVRLGSDERQQAGNLAPVNNEVIVLCQDGSTRLPCRADTPIQYATHSNAKTANSFEVQWTPPAAAAGDIKVYVAGNAANLNGQNTGDRIFLNNYTLRAGAATTPAPTIRSQNPVLQAFSNLAKLSAQTWIQIFGENFSTVTRPWAGADFRDGRAPTSLENVQVKVNNRDAFVAFVSPTQINAFTPDDDSLGPVDVTVTTPAGSSTTRLNKTRVSPAVLTTPAFNVGGRQYLAALHTDFTTFVGRAGLIAGVPFRPAAPGETIIVFAVGCGPTNPATPAGNVPAAAVPIASPVQVLFGQTQATVRAFLAANAVGLCQLNITVPTAASGDIAFAATVDGVGTDQTLFTTIQ